MWSRDLPLLLTQSLRSDQLNCHEDASMHATMRTYGAVAALAVLVTGCVGDPGALTGTTLPDQTIGAVVASPPVAILAVGGTQQLSITALSLTGTPITSFDSVRYFLQAPGDSLKVRLDAISGVLTGRAPSSSDIRINVIAWQNRALKGDQILAQVTATSISGATLSIQPVAPDSARLASGTPKTIRPVIRDPGTGVSISNPVMRYTVRASDVDKMRVYDPTISVGSTLARVSKDFSSLGTNQIMPLLGEGSAWVFATVNAYGTLLRDSVFYTFSYPYTATVASTNTDISGENTLVMTSTASGQTFILAPGATVTFQNSAATASAITMVYTFDNPAGATDAVPASSTGGASGNVTTLATNQSSRRRFLTAGTYRWTMTVTAGKSPWNGQKLTGTIVVR